MKSLPLQGPFETANISRVHNADIRMYMACCRHEHFAGMCNPPICGLFFFGACVVRFEATYFIHLKSRICGGGGIQRMRPCTLYQLISMTC